MPLLKEVPFAQALNVNLGTGAGQGHRIQIGRIVVGREHRPTPWQHGIPVDVGADSTGQHHARPVIARKGQGPLDRAGGEHGVEARLDAGVEIGYIGIQRIAQAAVGIEHRRRRGAVPVGEAAAGGGENALGSYASGGAAAS
mgnify:CR=1 FL=1